MANSAAARRTPENAPSDPMALVRTRADALYRAAVECCRQHDRSAKLTTSTDEQDIEHKHLDALCRMCDGSLTEMAEAYNRAAGNVHPERDEAWWHKANALWYASREYLRRNSESERASRRLDPHHVSKLGELHVDYELEASALLALQQAVDAYRKSRPDAVDCTPRR